MRKFFQSKSGFVVAGVVCLIAAVAIVLTFKSIFGESEAEAASNHRDFIDAQTLQPFKVDLRPGMAVPVKAPSGGMTGYPAEKCYWTKDGKAKAEPTLVLLNLYKGSREPTFCPDCGRLVVGHNPAPAPDTKPPPTKDEYQRNRPTRSER